MNAETFHTIRELVGNDAEILTELLNWLPGDMVRDFNDHLIRAFDLDYFYPDVFAGYVDDDFSGE